MSTCWAALRALAGGVACAVALAGCDAEPTRPTPAPAATWAPAAEAAEAAPVTTVTIGIHRIQAEIADTWPRRERGLSGRAELPAGRGMIFPYERPARPAFWMPDMHFDIDIVWIREGRIVDLHTDVPHRVAPPLPRYSPSEPIDWVLEVPAGTAARAGWKIGDPVHASPLPRFTGRESD